MVNRRNFLCVAGLLAACPLALNGRSQWRKGRWAQTPAGVRERAWRRTFRGVDEAQLHLLLGNLDNVNQAKYEGAPARTLLFTTFRWDVDSGKLEVNLWERAAGWHISIAVPTAGGGLLQTNKRVRYAAVEFRNLFPERRA